jgi:hypothetical protein
MITGSRNFGFGFRNFNSFVICRPSPPLFVCISHPADI